MRKRLDAMDALILTTIILLLIITVTGVLSFETDKAYSVKNQYGHEVEIFGSGIYAHDSYFKAPIFIGSDFTMLLLVVPMLIIALIRKVRRGTTGSRLFLIAVLGVVLYYAASIAFGVVYNSYQLLYIALFSCSLFAFIESIRKMDDDGPQARQRRTSPTKGVNIFLVASGVALFVAWLPDVIPTIISGNTLPLIEVYTTEITYALDMGILSPLMFVCLYLRKKNDGLGDILLAIILTLCGVIGVMIPVQTVYQALAGIVVPVPVMITKVGFFVVLAAFATYFNFRTFRGMDNHD